MEERADAGPSRRALVAGLLAAPAAISLAGCGIRLENDAPDVPGLRTQGPPPDQAVLLATLRSLQHVTRVADGTPDTASVWVRPVRTAHRAQVTRLVDVLAALGVEVPSAAGSASPSSSPTGTTAAPGPARLVAAELELPDDATEAKAWAASADNRPLLVSLCASRRAAASLLGTAPPGAHGEAPASAPALPIARAARPAVHGFELIAGKTPRRQRARVSATLGWLTGVRDDLGPVVDEPERASYPLPVPVTDADSLSRLARALLADVLTAVASQAGAVTERAAQQWLLRVWSLAAADHARWGAPVAPFPGLRT